MFETYKLNSAGIKEIDEFKKIMGQTMDNIDHLVPEGREGSIFLTKIEEAVFFGCKAIAAKAHNHTEVEHY